MNATTRSLEELRTEIDTIDRELHALISRRGGLAGEIAEIKALVKRKGFTAHPHKVLPSHTKTFLHQGETFQKELPHVFEKLKKACFSADKGSWGGKILGKGVSPRVRCIEYHD